MDNMKIYNKVRTVPKEAQKTIRGGRLNGMTDISPMWRIEKLTEIFGMVGFGWYYTVLDHWTETGAKGVVSCFVKIALYVKQGDEWSKPIEGVGGSAFVADERSGLYTSDECYKMALTDAISVSCKALGMGADVYWPANATKYQTAPAQQPTPQQAATPQQPAQPEKRRITLVQATSETFMAQLCEHMAKKCFSLLSEAEKLDFNPIAFLKQYYDFSPEEDKETHMTAELITRIAWDAYRQNNKL